MRIPLLSVAFSVSIASWCAGQTTIPVNQPVAQSVGINIHFTDPKPGEMEMLAESGVKWVRMDMLWNQSWSATEKARGVYDFSIYDRLFDALQSHGIRPIMIFAYGNPLYDKGLSPFTDEGRNAYATWAVAAAKRYSGRGVLWEVWNEPNGRTFWKPTPNAADYAKLVIAVGKAFREQAPQEALIGPALAKFDWPFIETCFQAGVLEYLSAVTVHPYRDSDPETVADDYRKLRRLINRYAPPGKNIPIISGEWGYFMRLTDKTTPELQGKLLARQWLTNLANEVALSIWYDWKDDGTNPKDIEHHFGTVSYDYHADKQPVYEPKPGYIAAKTLSSMLGGYRFSKPLFVGTEKDHVLLFEKDGDVRLAAWTTGEPHDLVVPASAGRFTVTSHTGQPLAPAVADQQGLKISLSDAPKYLTCDAPNDLLRLAAAWESLPRELKVRGPGNAAIEAAMRNPLGRTVHITAAGQSVELAAGQTVKLAMKVPVLRSEVRDVFRFEIDLEGTRLVQETRISVSNPLEVVLFPLGERQLMAQIENPSLEPFSGTVEFLATENGRSVKTSAPLVFAASQRIQMIDTQSAEVLPPNPTLEVTMKTASGEIVAKSTLSYSTDPAQGLASNAYGIWPQKDQAFAAGKPSQTPPTLRGDVMKLDYHFTGGPAAPATQQAASQQVLTLSITPRANQPHVTTIAGKPTSLVMWVYGDGSGNPMCARFIDSTGQVFQPQSAITWNGWKCLRLPLDDNTVWHYAGANDGVIHYPIKWHTLFLLDSFGKQTRSGTIYLATPTVIWDGPRH